MKLLIMHFSPVSCHLVPLKPKYPPQQFILKYSLPTFLPQRDRQVSHHRKQFAKILAS